MMMGRRKDNVLHGHGPRQIDQIGPHQSWCLKLPLDRSECCQGAIQTLVHRPTVTLCKSNAVTIDSAEIICATKGKGLKAFAGLGQR